MDTDDEINHWSSDQLDQLIAEIGRLRTEDLNADRMALSNNSHEISDSEIGKKLQRLYDEIDCWSGGIMDDYARKSLSFQKAFHGEDESQKLWYLDFPFDENGITASTKLKWLGARRKWPQVLLSRVIWSHLFEEIFNSKYPLGLHDTEGYDYVIAALKDKGRGEGEKESHEKANKWRSVEMQRLTSTKRFKKDKASCLRNCRQSLYQELSEPPISLDPKTLEKNFPDLVKRILHSAVELQEAISCSSGEYLFLTTHPHSPNYYHHTHPEVADRLRLTDVATWRPPKHSSSICDFFCCLFPGLYRIDTDFSVVKPDMLVYYRETDQELRKLQGQQPESKASPDKSKKGSSQVPSSSSQLSSSKDKKSSHSKPEKEKRQGKR